MQMRLARLKDRSRCLEQLILQEGQRAEAEELEGSVLRSCTVTQLRDMSRTLQDLVMSENRMQIPIFPPPSILRSETQLSENALSSVKYFIFLSKASPVPPDLFSHICLLLL
ncbi:hypothetical protein XENOCAPTIV_004153 [Xenoophorus captivus]|uniref:Uncharacterized protein n=1 Tax=Xenoophorus captivus TaxID=1517983 RepID=A0ABV0QGC1_9TELE